MPTAAELYYFGYGAGGQGKETLVLLHGAGGSLEQWPYQIRRLPGYRVLAPDLPGHGHSQGNAHSAIPEYAYRCHKWLDALGVAKAVVAGHSLGGAIALDLALEYPNLINGLVLVASAAQLPVNPQLLDLLTVPLKVQSGVNKIISWSFARESDEGLRSKLFSQLMANRVGVLKQDFQACASFNITERLSEIRIPAMLVIGSDDHMLSRELAEETTKAMSDAKLRVIRGGGHMLPQEKPLELREAIEEFLQGRL